MYCGQQSFGEIGKMQVKVSNKMNLKYSCRINLNVSLLGT